MKKDEEGQGVEAEFIVGTYQEFLLGYKLVKTNKAYSLKQSFTNHTHAKSIRSLAAIGKYIASGSADETIQLVNLHTRLEHGSLQPQAGTITCLATFGSEYLFSGSQDGSICIWKSGSWRCEKTFKRAHEKGVNAIAIHPSGKLALSIGEDKSLKTWNLIKGRKGYVTNLHAVADSIQFSPEGTHYAVGVSNRVDIYALDSAKVIYSIPFGKRTTCLAFRDNQTLFVAGDQESVEVHDILKSKKLTSFSAHKVRVKDMKYVLDHELLVTASNDGLIKIWNFPEKKSRFSSPPNLLTEVNTGCRIICLAVWTKDLMVKEEEGEDEDSSEEEIEGEEEIEDEFVEEEEEVVGENEGEAEEIKDAIALDDEDEDLEFPDDDEEDEVKAGSEEFTKMMKTVRKQVEHLQKKKKVKKRKAADAEIPEVEKITTIPTKKKKKHGAKT